ncbi:acyltransferase family-domain-containing protein [Bombardia bombarda]|uniref:Acyltransferase family-domain-containing protein n=1 Tax=Bombardia bombarda TaxID=252184 RepID=A0AA39XNR6_9PEZI|nr:acyltransferase family-domain-containing protein [Bombardia bombarda]
MISQSGRPGILDGTGGDDDNASWKLNNTKLGPNLPTLRHTLRWLKLQLWPKSSPDSGKPLRSTAYLDGLRGFAALLVYVHHNELWAHGATYNGEFQIFENAFGWHGEFRFVTFPIIRNFFTGGHFAVGTFYVISGYVLAAKPLALIQAGEHLKLSENLGSAFFRRWFRLYIPLLVTTLVWITSWHLFGFWNGACEAKATFREELWNWYAEFKNFSFLFHSGGGPNWLTFNTHLWSIPLEMRGSMVTYIACLALSRATTKARLLCQVLLVVYFLYIVDGFYCALFIAGMLQCDLDLLSRKDGYFPKFLRRMEPYKTFIYYHLFFIGMFLGGVPSQSQKLEDLRASPGWYWLSYLKPQAVFDFKWFYIFFAANMLMASIPRIWWLKGFFELRFCQFLGRISYALYMVHGPILNLVGDRLYHAVGLVRLLGDSRTHLAWWCNLWPLPLIGPMGFELPVLLPHIILLPLTLWVAHVVTRMVDEPAVRFAAWLYKRTLGGGVEPKEEDSVPLMRLE